MSSNVSVVIPCFNDGLYLGEALESVYSQTADDVEIIVVDDCSTDSETIKVIDSLEDEGRVKLLRHTENKGPSAARNMAIQHATGNYILPLDADDHILPTYIEQARMCLVNDSSLEIVYCRVRWFGLAFGEWKLPPYNPETFLVENVIFSTALFRRSSWELVGGYSENMVDGMEDYDFWLKILARGGSVHQLDEVLFEYRVKPRSRTAALKNENYAVERRAYECLLDNNIAFFSRSENVKTLYLSLLRRMREEREQRKSFLWRFCFKYFIRLELLIQVLLKRLVGRA